jgi:gamma-glutamylcyclotransferase (GGCT)/AIG2-like uncharacterized protein YtfP
LQPGFAPSEIAPVVERLWPIDEGFANGVLYDLGGCPGAVLDSSSDRRIIGTVFQLPDVPSVLRDLDAYEEYDPAAPGSSPFLRVLHPIVVAAGGTLQCWIYIYNRDPGSARILPSGRYQRSRGISE